MSFIALSTEGLVVWGVITMITLAIALIETKGK